jgi:hypothetical protein
MAKKDRIGTDPLSWIKDTRESPEEGGKGGTPEDIKVAKSEGKKVRKSEGVRVGKSGSRKVARPEGRKVEKSNRKKVEKSESEKKDKRSFSIAKSLLSELRLIAWYKDQSDSSIMEEALKQYLRSNKSTLEKARELREK